MPLFIIIHNKIIPAKIRMVKVNRSFPDNFFIHTSCLPVTFVNISYSYFCFQNIACKINYNLS